MYPIKRAIQVVEGAVSGVGENRGSPACSRRVALSKHAHTTDRSTAVPREQRRHKTAGSLPASAQQESSRVIAGLPNWEGK